MVPPSKRTANFKPRNEGNCGNPVKFELFTRFRHAINQLGPAEQLTRISGLLDIWESRTQPPQNTVDRQFHRRLYIPGLQPGPVFDLQFDHLLTDDILAAIQGECEKAFLCSETLTDYSDMTRKSSPATQKWLCSYLIREFQRDALQCRNAPFTLSFVETQRLGSEALFSRLAANTQISFHSDYVNYLITVHITLRATRAHLRIGDTDFVYRPGHSICFDPTYLHQVSNDGPGPRDILLFNIWHPDLSDLEIQAINLLSHTFTDISEY